MTKTVLAIFLMAVAMLVFAALFQMPMAAGGGAVTMLVGLIYAFVVTLRDLERSKYVQD